MAGIPFTGVGVALVTLFDDEQRLDFAATATHAARLVERGIRAVLVGGTVGEFVKLQEHERSELLAAVVKHLDGSAVVIAGVGATSTEQACRMTSMASEIGADCVLSTPDDDDVALHYESVKGAAGHVSVLAYSWPAKYPPGIGANQLDALSIDGCKDSSGDPKELLDKITQSSRPIYTGSSSLPLLCASVGGAGAILGAANAFPELCIAAFSGDGDAQRELHAVQVPRRSLPFPSNVKQMTFERFGTSRVTRT